MLSQLITTQFEGYEITFMRIFFSYVIYKTFLRKRIKFNSQPSPNGIARFIDFSFLNKKAIYSKLRYFIFILLFLYAAGMGLPLITLLLLIYTVCIGTYFNSQGAISHHSQVISLVLLVQTFVYIYGVVNPYLKLNYLSDSTISYNQLAMFFSQQAVVSVYFTSALTKLIRSKFRWVYNVKDIPVQIEKTNMQNYYDELSAPPASWARNVMNWCVRYPVITISIFSLGLLLELMSPFSLISRSTNIIFGLMVIGFHGLNSTLFKLKFDSLQRLIVIYFINIPYLIILLSSMLV